MRKKYLIAGVVLALSLSMVGCGKDTGSTTAEGTTENVTTEAEVASDTDTEEVTEEEVEEVSTWFSENGISFTEGEVSIPVYTCAQNEDGSEDDSIEVKQKNATYSEPSVNVSEPDADGNITYTVTYNVSGTWIGTMAVERSYSGFVPYEQGTLYYFVDAYTGTVFPNADMTDEENSYTVDSVVEVDGKEYKVSTSQSLEYSDQGTSWSDFDNNTKTKATIAYTFNITMTAVVPAGYDGLILALNGAGVTGKDDLDTEIKEAQPFDGNVSDYIFKDVAYGEQEKWQSEEACISYDCSQSSDVSQVILRVSTIDIMYNRALSDNDMETIQKEGYVTVKCKDGTTIPLSGMITGECRQEGEDAITGVILGFNSKIDRKQLQSILINGEEFTDVLK